MTELLPFLGEPMLHRERAGQALSRILNRPLDANHCVIGGDGQQKIEGRFHMDFFKGDQPPKGDWLALMAPHEADAPTFVVGVIATNELHDAWEKIAWGHFRIPHTQLKPPHFLAYLAQPCAGCGVWPTSAIRRGRHLCGRCFEGERNGDGSEEGAAGPRLSAPAGHPHR